MPDYKYTARNDQGEQVAGEVDAATELAARAILESRGLEVEQLSIVSEEIHAALSSQESQEVANRLAQLSNSSLPLASGLRAAADECGSRRVAQAMYELASRVENGQSLEEVLSGSSAIFAPHIAGLVLAATKTGNLGAALSELLEHQRSSRTLRRSIMRGFAYPIFVACLAVLVLLFVVYGISDIYIDMFKGFGLQLPISTRLLIWWRDYGAVNAVVLLSGCTVVSVILRLVLRRATWSRFVAGVPVFGPLSYWSGLAEWCSLLGVLIKNQVALPEALRLSATGISNAYVAQIAENLASQSSAGCPLTELLADERPLPRSLVPLVRWGERVGLLHEAFETAHELFDRRVKVRALMLQSILPPILFILIACGVVMVIGALFAPMTSMISGLS